MNIPDPIKPYLATIRLILYGLAVVLIFGAGGFAGCKIKEHSNDKELQTITENRDYWKGQSEANAAAIEENNRQVEANKQFAREQQKIAEQAMKDRDAAQKANKQQAATFDKKLKDARKDPDCGAVLRMNLCPILQDY